MFYNAQCFNQDLSSWDVSSVTNLSATFKQCYSLRSNASFSGWDTSSVTDMSSTFTNCNFTTAGLSGWDTSSVTSMYAMFNSADYFNEDIGSWDVSNVTDMGYMLHTAYRFDQDLSSWDTSSVTSLSHTFWQTGWNTNSNLYLGLSGWDVSSVTNMYRTFYNCRYFNENLSSWNLASINFSAGLYQFMYGVTLSNTNYDALLNGWNNNKLAASNGVANWRTDLSPHFGNSKYTSAGASARQDLIDYGWTITDGGLQT
jgi:surface protein